MAPCRPRNRQGNPSHSGPVRIGNDSSEPSSSSLYHGFDSVAGQQSQQQFFYPPSLYLSSNSSSSSVSSETREHSAFAPCSGPNHSPRHGPRLTYDPGRGPGQHSHALPPSARHSSSVSGSQMPDVRGAGRHRQPHTGSTQQQGYDLPPSIRSPCRPTRRPREVAERSPPPSRRSHEETMHPSEHGTRFRGSDPSFTPSFTVRSSASRQQRYTAESFVPVSRLDAPEYYQPQNMAVPPHPPLPPGDGSPMNRFTAAAPSSDPRHGFAGYGVRRDEAAVPRDRVPEPEPRPVPKSRRR